MYFRGLRWRFGLGGFRARLASARSCPQGAGGAQVVAPPPVGDPQTRQVATSVQQSSDAGTGNLPQHGLQRLRPVARCVDRGLLGDQQPVADAGALAGFRRAGASQPFGLATWGRFRRRRDLAAELAADHQDAPWFAVRVDAQLPSTRGHSPYVESQRSTHSYVAGLTQHGVRIRRPDDSLK